MLIILAIGAAFVILHIATALVFAPRMPQKMITHWGLGRGGLRPNGWMTKRWGLRMGVILSLFLTVANLIVGPVSGIYLTIMVAQLVSYFVFIWMYVQNTKK